MSGIPKLTRAEHYGAIRQAMLGHEPFNETVLQEADLPIAEECAEFMLTMVLRQLLESKTP